MEQEDMSGNEEEDTRSERGTPEGSFESSNVSLEIEELETGRETSIFKYYSYKNTGEFFKCR